MTVEFKPKPNCYFYINYRKHGFRNHKNKSLFPLRGCGDAWTNVQINGRNMTLISWRVRRNFYLKTYLYIMTIKVEATACNFIFYWFPSKYLVKHRTKREKEKRRPSPLLDFLFLPDTLRECSGFSFLPYLSLTVIYLFCNKFVLKIIWLKI